VYTNAVCFRLVSILSENYIILLYKVVTTTSSVAPRSHIYDICTSLREVGKGYYDENIFYTFYYALLYIINIIWNIFFFWVRQFYNGFSCLYPSIHHEFLSPHIRRKRELIIRIRKYYASTSFNLLNYTHTYRCILLCIIVITFFF